MTDVVVVIVVDDNDDNDAPRRHGACTQCRSSVELPALLLLNVEGPPGG